MAGDCKCGVCLGAKRNVGYGWLGIACLRHDAGLGGKAFIAGKGQHGVMCLEQAPRFECVADLQRGRMDG